MDAEIETCDGGEMLPWVVAIEKPSYGDDPWFRSFCRAMAEGLLHYKKQDEHLEQRDE